MNLNYSGTFYMLFIPPALQKILAEDLRLSRVCLCNCYTGCIFIRWTSALILLFNNLIFTEFIFPVWPHFVSRKYRKHIEFSLSQLH